jgi:sulfite exporter TauE/SafE
MGNPITVRFPINKVNKGNNTMQATQKTTSRKEHMAWCKQRAIAEVNAGNIAGGLASMVSDLNKHSDTQGHTGIKLGMTMLMAGLLNSKKEMIKFIEDFN